MRNKIVILAAIFSLFSTANAWILAVKGGKIFTMSGNILENGTVLIENNRFSAVGKDIEIPSQAEIIDATGKIITPGLFDAYTNIGLVEIGAVSQTVDIDESSAPITAAVRVIDAFNTESIVIPITRVEGITTVLVAPGTGNVIAGQSAVFDLAGETVNDMLIKSPAALHINFGESTTSQWRRKNKIETRMGLVAVLRQAFLEGKEYHDAIKNYEQKSAAANDNRAGKKISKKSDEIERPVFDYGNDIIAAAQDKKIPVIASAKRKDDILAAIRFAEEFDLKLIILFGTESYMVADILKSKNIPVLLGPITTQPSSMETLGAIYECAALLENTGVKFAIITGGAHGARDLRFHAGIAVQYGLSFEGALRAITIAPAEILGVQNELGSIEKGKIANLVIFESDPLQPLTDVDEVIIEGRRIPLRNYQTELYDKFK